MSVENVTQTGQGSSQEHLTSASYQNNPYPVPDSQREPLVLEIHQYMMLLRKLQVL